MAAIFDQIECSFFAKNTWLICLVGEKNNFGFQNKFLGRWGGIFFRPWSLFRNWGLRIEDEDWELYVMIGSIIKKKWVFKKWGLILIFWNLLLDLKCLLNLLIGWLKANTGDFREMRINPQFLKTPRKAPWVKLIIHYLGGKSHKKWPNFFYGLGIHRKNTFCKKIGQKRPIQLSAVANIIYIRLYGVATAN